MCSFLFRFIVGYQWHTKKKNEIITFIYLTAAFFPLISLMNNAILKVKTHGNINSKTKISKHVGHVCFLIMK